MTTAITGLSSMGTRQILGELAAIYERQSGHTVSVRSMGGVEAARLVRAGEATDIVVLASTAMDLLEKEGHVAARSQVGFARSGMAVAVPAGAPRPGIGNEDAVRQAILDAPRICYSTGPSGDHLVKLWERWGIAEAVSRRAVQAPPGVPVGELLARGEADLGFQQLSELMHVPGIDLLGPLPPDIQAITVFSAGIATTSSQPDAARALIAFLASPDAEAAKRLHGMEPA